MLEELNKLIDFIYVEYIEFNKKWRKNNNYSNFNLRNNQVNSLINNEEMLNTIFNYREFIIENNIQLMTDFNQFNTIKSKVNIRAKTKNSIEYKIKNYIQNHENGKIPIDKCLNDLFGIRIICLEELKFNEIKDLIEQKNKNLKCINSSKQIYKATHIYFKQDNFDFQWELQIWNKLDEMNNIDSHEKYKQDYVRWENENKGGNAQW